MRDPSSVLSSANLSVHIQPDYADCSSSKPSGSGSDSHVRDLSWSALKWLDDLLTCHDCGS